MLERPESRDRSMRGVRRNFETLLSTSEQLNSATCLPYVYFSLFDGHAGVGAAVAAANQLHHILHVSVFHITALSCVVRFEVYDDLGFDTM